MQEEAEKTVGKLQREVREKEKKIKALEEEVSFTNARYERI